MIVYCATIPIYITMLDCCTPLPIDEYSSPSLVSLMKILDILLVAESCLGVLSLFIDTSSGFYLLIGALLLYCTKRSKHYYTCAFYIILSIMQLYTTVLLVCQVIGYAHSLTPLGGFTLILREFLIPFLIISIFYTFLIYREFKGIS